MIDPVATSSAFATIVGLLSDFVSQRRQSGSNDFQEFVRWLMEHQHGEVVQLLSQQARTVTSVKAMLTQDREELRGQLDALDRTLAAMACALDGLGSVAHAVHPDAALSRQAVSILRQFDKAGASKAIRMDTSEGPHIAFTGPNKGSMSIDEPRFLDDDMNALVQLELLGRQFKPNGHSVYVYTRRAADLVRFLGTQNQ